MAGSHEVRGSIPLGSTTDTRGARRRRRAPLFCFRAHRTERAYRTKSVSHSGAPARAGAPFSFARTRRPIQAPVRRRGHRARQQGPEEGAHLSAGVRRPPPAPPRARPMRPAARRGGDAFGAGLHGPRGVRECGIVPVKNAWLAVADPPPARTRPPPWRSRRRLCPCGGRSAVKGGTLILRIPE